ncbi:aquaporin-like protein [Aspergillus varians]
MADSGSSRPRPRAQSDAAALPQHEDHLQFNLSPTRSVGGAAAAAVAAAAADRQASGQATETGTGEGTGEGTGAETEGAALRRRGTGLSRRQSRLNRVPSLTSHTTLARRTQGNFTLAGPDETAQLYTAHQPFVHPAYTDLNPEYEQPHNTKPVWSLAKPLPRVVRPGMVPTRAEVLQAKQQLPAEQSQKLGLDVDPNELEAGRIQKSSDPRKMAAGVGDARAQRETNFANKLLTGETGETRLSRTSSSRVSNRRRPSASGTVPSDKLSAVPESEAHSDPGVEPPDDTRQDQSDERLHAVAEEHSEPDSIPEDHLNGFAESAFPEDLHPLVQDLIEDEVHNNHTVWSVIRTHHREALAESLAVFIQLTVALSADLSVTLAATTNPNTASWAWGMATMMAIYISGGVSGAHLNPTITCMLWFYRGFPKRKMPEYFAAQFLGAFVAALAVYGLYHQSITEYLSSSTAPNPTTHVIDSFVTSQRNPWITPATAFFNEFIGTLVLSVTILALGDDRNAPPGAGMNALVVGLMTYTLCITFSYQTGAALNPSRDFGPRLALLALGYGGGLFTDPYWFYGPWAGTFCGAWVGAFLYDFMIFTGGESPVNYPLERTQRAMRRKKMKWRRRLRLGRESEKAIV